MSQLNAASPISLAPAAALPLALALVVLDGPPPPAVGSVLDAAGLRPEFVRGRAELERVLAAHTLDAAVVVAGHGESTALAAVRRIRSVDPDAKIVLVAAGDDLGIGAREALNAGAEAYVPEREADRLLGPALEAVMVGFVCAPRQLRRLVAKPTFSHREKEVLGLLVEGLTNRQIGAELFLAESTVKSHLVSAFAKLGVRSRKDAVALLLDGGEGLAATALPRHAAQASAASTSR
jgi:DNA-binding NarL/FixJ family response regulator